MTLLDYLNKHRAPIEDINTIESSIVIREVAVKSKTDSLETKNSAEVLTQSIQSSTKPLLVSTSNKPKQQYSLRNQTIHVLPKRPLSKTTFPQATSSKRNVVRSATDTSKKPVPTAKAVPVQRNLHNRSKTVIEISITNNRHSREDIDSSTSTLKASSETIMNEVESKSRKSEPKSLQSSKVSDEGEWLTVKNKRRSSLHWHQTRFNKPSSTASLPTLALLDESAVIIEKDEPKVKLADNRTKINEKRVKELSEKKVMAKVDSNIKGITEKSPKTAISTSSISKPRHKPSNVTKPRVYTTHSNGKNPLKLAPTDNILSLDHKILRQRSDLTGLKLKSLNKEYLKSERSQNLTQQKKKTETSADLYIDKIDMKTQTSLISNTIDKLYMECFEAEKEQDKIKYRNGDLSSCDELEEKDDFESDDDQKKMLEEQVENLERQIRELENTGEFFLQCRINEFT